MFYFNRVSMEVTINVDIESLLEGCSLKELRHKVYPFPKEYMQDKAVRKLVAKRVRELEEIENAEINFLKQLKRQRYYKVLQNFSTGESGIGYYKIDSIESRGDLGDWFRGDKISCMKNKRGEIRIFYNKNTDYPVPFITSEEKRPQPVNESEYNELLKLLSDLAEDGGGDDTFPFN